MAISLFIANGLRKGYRWAWWIAVVLSGFQVLFAALISVLVIIVLIVSEVDPDAETDLNGVPQFLACRHPVSGVPDRADRWAAAPSGCPGAANDGWPPARSHPDTAKELLRRWGGSTISWMTTWPENRHMITEDGQSYIAFRKHAGVAVALGDPVGPPGLCRVHDQRLHPAVRQGGHGAVHLLLHQGDRLGHRRARLAERAGRRGQPDRPAGPWSSRARSGRTSGRR